MCMKCKSFHFKCKIGAISCTCIIQSFDGEIVTRLNRLLGEKEAPKATALFWVFVTTMVGAALTQKTSQQKAFRMPPICPVDILGIIG